MPHALPPEAGHPHTTRAPAPPAEAEPRAEAPRDAIARERPPAQDRQAELHARRPEREHEREHEER
jgi:hypothetical protein